MKIWTLTDGKIGDRVQCAGIASALGGERTDKTIDPRAPFEWFAPYGPIDPRDASGADTSPIAPPFPDLLIASGRRAAPYARAVKRDSGGKTFVALLKDPRIRARFADLIWAPLHDRRRGDNVFATLTSPHGLAEKIAVSAVKPRAQIAALPKPMLGVVLGGPSGGAKYDLAAAASFAEDLGRAAGAYASLAITPSRRTPKQFIDMLSASVSSSASFIWNGEGENPYTDILGNAETLIVAADSHNMMSEAAATRAGVYAWRPSGLARKLSWFVSELEKAGRVRSLAGDISPFSARPIDTTEEIAAEIMKRYRNR